MHKFNEKGIIAQVLILLVLSVGIVGGVYLVTHPQIFKSRATNQPIVIKDKNGNILPEINGIPQTTDTKIKLELTSPLGPAATLSASPSPGT